MASKLVTQEQSAAILGKQGQDEYLWSWPAEYRLHTIPTGSKAARARTYRKSYCSVPSNCALLLVQPQCRSCHSLSRAALQRRHPTYSRIRACPSTPAVSCDDLALRMRLQDDEKAPQCWWGDVPGDARQLRRVLRVQGGRGLVRYLNVVPAAENIATHIPKIFVNCELMGGIEHGTHTCRCPP